MTTNVSSQHGRRFGTLLDWDPTRLFDDLMTWPSPVDVQQTDDMVTMAVDMPGVDADAVDLTFETGTLSITGNRGEHSYRYSVALGNTIDPNTIEARLDKGVLTVQAQKRPETKPRKILIGAPSQKTLDSGKST